MKGMEIINLRYATDIIMAAFCLHNFILSSPANHSETDVASDDEGDDNEDYSSSDDDDDKNAVEKRARLTEYFAATFADDEDME